MNLIFRQNLKEEHAQLWALGSSGPFFSPQPKLNPISGAEFQEFQLSQQWRSFLLCPLYCEWAN